MDTQTLKHSNTQTRYSVILGFLMLSLFFVGCNKNADLLKNDFSQEESEIVGELNPNLTIYTIDEMLEIAQNFSTDYASFKDMNEASSFIISFGELTEYERDNLLNNLKYQTITQYLDDILDELDLIDNKEEFKRYVRENNRYLKLIKNWDNEDEVVYQNVSNHNFKFFLNSDQIVKIGNEFFKYIDDYRVNSPSYESLERVINVDVIEGGNLPYIKVVESVNKKLEYGEIELRDATVYRWDTIKDVSGCKNDRRVDLELTFVYNINEFWDPGLGSTTQVVITRYAKLSGKRKGIPCIWYSYKTNLKWYNFKFKYTENYNGNYNYVTWTYPNTEKETKSIERWDNIAFYVANWDYYDVYWTLKQSSINSRGVDIWKHIYE